MMAAAPPWSTKAGTVRRDMFEGESITCELGVWLVMMAGDRGADATYMSINASDAHVLAVASRYVNIIDLPDIPSREYPL
jgi:hypothetical protein